jgi:hypothetical protein
MGSNSLHAQIACAENIHPLQSETCKHLHAPPPETADCDEFLDEFFVAGTYEHSRGEFAVCEFLSEARDVFCFALRQTCGAESGQVFCDDLCW